MAMTKGEKIVLAISLFSVAAITIGAVGYNKGWFGGKNAQKADGDPSKPAGKQNATLAQYEDLKKIVAKIGSDMFEGLSPDQSEIIKYKFTHNLTQEEAHKLLMLIQTEEKYWSVTDKVKFGIIIGKIKPVKA